MSIAHSYHESMMEPAIRSLNERGRSAACTIPNRVVLAPLAGIGNWFVRLQAKRYGAGLAVSEMVSSFAVHYGNERTCTELLRIHPDEHPVSVQLFGSDPDVMASAAERVAAAGADLIDINMGCPVPKVCKTGAGAALLDDPDGRWRVARAAARGSGLPVTVKLRTGLRAGDRAGVDVARALAERRRRRRARDPPAHASQRHSGQPDYDLVAQLVEELPVPVLISGGLRSAELAREAFEPTGADAVLLARGVARQPVAVRSAARRAGSRADARGDPRRARLGDRSRRRASRRRAREPLSAQVLPVVHRAPRGHAREQAALQVRAPGRSDAGCGAGAASAGVP